VRGKSILTASKGAVEKEGGRREGEQGGRREERKKRRIPYSGVRRSSSETYSDTSVHVQGPQLLTKIGDALQSGPTDTRVVHVEVSEPGTILGEGGGPRVGDSSAVVEIYGGT
jgi:hypothetical protein